MKKALVFISLVVFEQQKSFAQNDVSPYSIVGIGDIQQSTFDRSSGMGNTGLSLSSSRFMYHANPASYAKLADHYFSMEVTMRYKDITYSGNNITIDNNRSTDFSVEKFAVAIKLRPKWAVSLGLMPFSTSNYSFYSKKNIQGSDYYAPAYYEGNGGLNQIYLSNAFTVAKNLRLGLQSTVLFGNFTQKETFHTDSIGLTSAPIITTSQFYTSKIYFKAGLQYDLKLNKNWSMSVGAVAARKTNLNANYTVTVSQDSGTIATKESLKTNYFIIPSVYGGGISLTHKDKLTFSVDYQRQLWGELQYKGLNYELLNSTRISGGVEYSHKLWYKGVSLENYYIQGGYYYNGSYLKINGVQLKDYGITAGVGFNMKGTEFGKDLSYQFNLGVGTRGTTKNNLIRENYVQATITLLYRDFWFTKMKKYF